VHRKGLAALLLAATALTGCGGGGGGEAKQASTTTTEASTPQEAVAQLKDKAAQVREERESSPSQADGSREGEGSSAPKAPQPDPHPQSAHHDSGGGTSQFATKTGDNSIQESGQEGSQAQAEDAAAVLHAYLDARVAHDWDEACFYVAASLSATIELFAERYAKDKGIEGCPETLEAFASGSGQQALLETAKVNVGALRIDGDRGFLLYHGAGGAPYAMPMVREGGAWKVGSLDGVPLG
jgi:hypothetical protein